MQIKIIIEHNKPGKAVSETAEWQVSFKACTRAQRCSFKTFPLSVTLSFDISLLLKQKGS